FFAVFPEATVWRTYKDAEGYDLVLLGRAEETPISVDEIDRRLHLAANAKAAQSLAEAGFPSAPELLGTYAGRAADLQPMLAGAQINDDLSMRLQYLAGMGVNSKEAANLYHEILSYRQYPEGLFTGSGEGIQRLRELLQKPALTF